MGVRLGLGEYRLVAGVLEHSVLEAEAPGLMLQIHGWERRGLYGGVDAGRVRRREGTKGSTKGLPLV